MLSVDRFLARWSASGDAERANKDSFLNELCDVLGVERPHPKTGSAGDCPTAIARSSNLSASPKRRSARQREASRSNSRPGYEQLVRVRAPLGQSLGFFEGGPGGAAALGRSLYPLGSRDLDFRAYA